jgi:hypothetical protein
LVWVYWFTSKNARGTRVHEENINVACSKYKIGEKMDRRHYVSILIILILVFVIFFEIYSHRFVPASTPKLLYDYEISPAEIVNTTQGATLQVNFTLTSMCSAKIAIPIELKLLGYDSTIEGFDTLPTFGWGGGFDFWNTSVVQERVFNYSLSFGKLTLQPQMSNSTIITISLADDAPIGRYLVFLYLGSIEFLSPPGEYEVSYGSDMEFGIIVTSNE